MSNVIQQIQHDKLVPVFYDSDLNRCIEVLEQCYAGGVRTFEFTNRGANAKDIFPKLKEYADAKLPGMLLGMGTVWTPEEAEHFIGIGAQFIVSPVLQVATGEACARRGIPWMPGCMTPTEVYTAQQAGATVVKIFPGSVTGPGFIKSLKAVLPSMHFMVTGGVSPTPESLSQWFSAGVMAVGIGKELLQRDIGETYRFIQSL